jgi:cysteine-rich secretory family protein
MPTARLHPPRVLTVGLGCLLVFGTLMAQPAQARRRSPMDTVVAIVNKAREALGAVRLPLDKDLSREARSHSRLMARSRRLDPPHSGEAAENVIVASTPARLARAALRLPEIARNLMAPQWDGVGVGIVRGSRGTYWATFLFHRVGQPGSAPLPVAVPGSPIPEPPPPPAGAPVSSPPASIASNCTLPVENQLMAWLNTVPDNSVVQFPPGACYGLDDTITLEDRVGLFIDGNGSTFKALTPGTGNRDNWRFEGGTNITVKNMIVRGANPHAGVTGNAYDGTREWQHGFRFAGTQTAMLDNVQVYDMYGDFVEAMWDWRYGDVSQAPMAKNITVKNSRFERNGRMGFGLTGVEGFVLRDSYIGEVNMAAVDLELDFDEALGRNINILNNTFGKHRFALFANGGAGSSPNLDVIMISGNREIAQPVTCESTIFSAALPGTYRTNWTITNNQFITLSDTLLLEGARSVTVANNSVDYKQWGGCGRFAGVGVTDSHNISITGNAFTGADQVVRTDATSTQIVQSGNTL